MQRDAIETIGEAHLAEARPAHRGACHAFDPGVAPGRDVEDGVLVLAEQRCRTLPHRLGRPAAGECDQLGVALQQFQRHPACGIGRRHVRREQRMQVLEDLAMRLGDLRPQRCEAGRVAGEAQRRLGELRHSLGASRHQRHHRQTERGGEHRRIDGDALSGGHVGHVEAEHHRRIEAERKQLGEQVEAALERGGVHDHDHRIRLLEDQEIAGHALLGRVRAQAVGAGQVDQGGLDVAVA